MKRGYTKLWRKSKDSIVFSHEGLWKLWTLCLLKANFQEVEIEVPGGLQPIFLKPGQFVTGRYALHEDYHQAHIQKRRYSRKLSPTPYTLWRWLMNLEKMGMLTIRACNKFSVISIANWLDYQTTSSQMSDTTKLGNFCTLSRAIVADSEHQKNDVEADKPTILENNTSKFEQQVSNRRAAGEHGEELNNHIKELTVDLYSFYLEKIAPKEKSRQRALSNIASHLQKHSADDLRQAIINYRSIAAGREPQYRKNPANFFGKQEPAFLDYLPGHFETRGVKQDPGRPKFFSVNNPEDIEELFKNE